MNPIAEASPPAPIASSARRRPDFLGLGGMRCGSTTLWNMLKAQPDVFLPERKELHYFDNADGLRDRGLEAYLDYFDQARPDQVCGEITPEYLSVESCARQIHDLLPEARLLVVLRDPVPRAWSHYRMSVSWGGETWPFDRAVRAEERRLASGGIVDNIAFSYLERGRYIEHLKRFEALFGREAILVLLLPDLEQRAEETMRQVRQHIGLPAVPPGDTLEVPSDQSNTLGSFPRHLGLNRRLILWRDRARAGHSPLHRASRRVLNKLMTINRLPRVPRPDPRTNAWLRDYFAPHDAELEAWLGRPIPWRSRD